jgi:hypothetical protein
MPSTVLVRVVTYRLKRGGGFQTSAVSGCLAQVLLTLFVQTELYSSETAVPVVLVEGSKQYQKVWCRRARVPGAQCANIYVMWMNYFNQCLHPLSNELISQLTHKCMDIVNGQLEVK